MFFAIVYISSIIYNKILKQKSLEKHFVSVINQNKKKGKIAAVLIFNLKIRAVSKIIYDDMQGNKND